MFRIVRIIVNSFAGCLMLLIASVVYIYSPWLAVLVAVASFDQFEDVYFYASGKRLIPAWLAPVDVLFEGVCASLGLAVALFSLVYMAYFNTWFFQMLFALSVPMVWSAVEDIGYWGSVIGVVHEVRQEKRFVRRRE